ncbi:small ribosomal subunit Rsm22 family protein [Occallatibacter riparius]|uniref:Small ribosomal subunit Rsm22 family protein n=1 Tax=Occallatibacter riparius TaxID=1002689 RepID=A0A9J7BN54_9BACT|nr:small ribosomal subunit Rsm22 family protein [Occallatibacter riparius]UWZ84131.1 small ribosomal subunit Rsm22 family protein [Occallatibacter riparius]
MILPGELRAAIEAQLDHVSLRGLTQAAETLRERYRAGERNVTGRLVQSPEQTLAYAAYRLPSTYSAIHSALFEASQRLPEWAPATLVEAGCGPGPAVWAASELWPSLESATLLDADARMLSIARTLAQSSQRPSVQQANVQSFDLLADRAALPQGDLVVAAYVLGELPAPSRVAVIDRLWASTRSALVLVEGSKSSRGFDVILAARQRLIEQGAKIVAPCPGEGRCPKREGDTWCHFAQRVERSQAQRILKEGFRSYEDEKFSYVVAARESSQSIVGRVTLQPHVVGNLARVEVCGTAGLEQWTIRKSQKVRFRRAKKLYWGEAIEANDPLVNSADEDSSVE